MTVHFVRAEFVFTDHEDLDHDYGDMKPAHLKLNVHTQRGYDLAVNEILNNQKIAYLVRKHMTTIQKFCYNYGSELDYKLSDELEELVKVYDV